MYFLFVTCSYTDQLSSGDVATVQNLTWDARSQWYNIGLNLGISTGSLDAIKKTHHGDCEECYTKVLSEWLRNHPRPTWSALADALRAPSVKMTHIAEKLPNMDKRLVTVAKVVESSLIMIY